MFTYTLTFQDAIQAFVKFKTSESSDVDFDNPGLNQVYQDEAQGLCTITLRQPRSNDITIRNIQDSILEIHYADPELEFQRRLAL